VPFPSVFRSKFTVSQNNSFSRQFEDFNDYVNYRSCDS
jgi:hypothetical protein